MSITRYTTLCGNGSGSAAANGSSHKLSKLRNTSSGAFWDPVAVLPPELALVCLRTALPWSSDYPATLLDFSSVSARWRNFLLSAPVLWREIHINALSQDLLATIALFVHLSGKARLKLVLWTSPGPEWIGIKHTLVSHMHRIDALILGEKPSSAVDNRGYFAFMTNMINMLDHPSSLAELDFGGRLLLDPSQLPLLDLPPSMRITSPIEVSLNYGGFPGLYLTRFTGIEQGDFVIEPLVFPDLLCDIVSDPSGDDDYTVSALSSRISYLRNIVDLLSSSSTSTERLASSMCAVFFEDPFRIQDTTSATWRQKGEGDTCRICGALQGSLEAILGCIRFHFGLYPFHCAHCAERFTTPQRSQQHAIEHRRKNVAHSNFELPYQKFYPNTRSHFQLPHQSFPPDTHFHLQFPYPHFYPNRLEEPIELGGAMVFEPFPRPLFHDGSQGRNRDQWDKEWPGNTAKFGPMFRDYGRFRNC